MYDNGVGVLSQYGLTAITTCKGRGAMLCETETGWKSIQEFGGARNKLELQCQLQEQLMRSGAVQTDCPLRNETGELVSQGEDGLFYVVREWHPGKECDTRSIPEIRRAASAMARLHKAACLPLQKEYEKESLISECVRHNAEIRKIKKYISKKQKKNTFEKLLLGSADEFLEQGEAAVEELKQSDYEQLREQARQRGNICHGEFNQHNILFSGGQDIVIHFDKWNFDLPEADQLGKTPGFPLALSFYAEDSGKTQLGPADRFRNPLRLRKSAAASGVRTAESPSASVLSVEILEACQPLLWGK